MAKQCPQCQEEMKQRGKTPRYECEKCGFMEIDHEQRKKDNNQ